MSPQPDTKHKHHSVLPYRLAQTTSFYILLQPLRTSYFKASFSLAPACSLFLPGHDTILALYLYDEALEFQKYACYLCTFSSVSNNLNSPPDLEGISMERKKKTT